MSAEAHFWLYFTLWFSASANLKQIYLLFSLLDLPHFLLPPHTPYTPS